MRSFSLKHLSDAALVQSLNAAVARDRGATANVVSHIAEYDSRQLYLPAGYSSMHSYCVDGLRFSDDAASKRIHAARSARKFPVLFSALEEGRLHLTAVCMLAPHLTAANVDDLVRAATHKRKWEIDQLLAERFPQPEMLSVAATSISRLPSPQHALAHAGRRASAPAAPARTAAAPVTPIAPERYAVHLTISASTRDKLREVQELLSHALPSGDLAVVFDRALDALLSELKKRKFADTPRPGRPRGSTRKRHIPASVRRAVWKRDQGQCTFVSESGRRCEERRYLEFDHADPVARGGEATVDRIRLRCRGHNQLEAERVFGSEFMKNKRERARHAARAEQRASGVP